MYMKKKWGKNNMFNKRLKCTKCGRTLLTGCTRNVVSVECSCGEVVYPNEKHRMEWEKDEVRHKKYK